MVGEIRDVETAKISIEAALTGHSVLSTLHTNDAPSAITRLIEMGVEPFLTASAISAVLAQRLDAQALRLLRRVLHPDATRSCLPPTSPTDELARYDGVRFKRKVGCTRCGNTGYRGRIGVFQLLRMSESIVEPGRSRRATRTRSSASPSRRACARSGPTASRRWRRAHLDRRARPRRLLMRAYSLSGAVRSARPLAGGLIDVCSRFTRTMLRRRLIARRS